MINGASYSPTAINFGDAFGFIADKGTLTFDGASWPDDSRAIWTDGSTPGEYIPRASAKHVLPDGAMLPVLRASDRWACPTPEKFAEVRALIEQTSATGDIVRPGWERMRHLVGLHLGGPQPDIAGDDTARFPETRIEWYQQNAGQSLGYQRKRGWYFGTLPGRDANGISNWHYNRLWAMTIAMVYEDDHEKRKAAWAHYVQQAIAYTAFGRMWSGPWKGMARDEKGQTYVGDSGKFLYEKDWTLNLVGPWLLTGQTIFRAALVNAAEFYSRSTYAWGGAWGARIPGRMLGNMLSLWLVLPEYRWALEREMGEVMDMALRQLDGGDRWINEGNNGKGPMSGWMHSEYVAEHLRVQEHVPALNNRGMSLRQCATVMRTVMATDRGIDGGSETVGKYALLRYRFSTPMATDPMVATHPVHTAFALPALRLLQDLLPDDYAATLELVQRFAGSHMAHVIADTPRPLTEIGYREPHIEGPAAPKTWCEWVDAIR